LNNAPEICLAIVVVLVVVFLSLHRTSRTPPMLDTIVISAEPPRASSAPPTAVYSTSLSAFADAGGVRGFTHGKAPQ
jgi:hypothetical protein